MSRTIKSVKLNGAAGAPRVDLYRRFIPDARSSTPNAVRGHFWYKLWFNFRASR